MRLRARVGLGVGLRVVPPTSWPAPFLRFDAAIFSVSKGMTTAGSMPG